MDALAMRRKVRVKGSVKTEEAMVCDNLRLKRVKKCVGGKPAALKSDWRR